MTEEEEGDGGHHSEHWSTLKELLQDVKEEDDAVPVSSDELDLEFGPLRIGILENKR